MMKLLIQVPSSWKERSLHSLIGADRFVCLVDAFVTLAGMGRAPPYEVVALPAACCTCVIMQLGHLPSITYDVMISKHNRTEDAKLNAVRALPLVMCVHLLSAGPAPGHPASGAGAQRQGSVGQRSGRGAGRGPKEQVEAASVQLPPRQRVVCQCPCPLHTHRGPCVHAVTSHDLCDVAAHLTGQDSILVLVSVIPR